MEANVLPSNIREITDFFFLAFRNKEAIETAKRYLQASSWGLWEGST